MKNDLDILFPERVIEIKGEKITLYPLKLGQLPKVMKLISSVIKPLSLLPNSIVGEVAAEGPSNPIIAMIIEDLLVNSSQPALEFLSVATGKPLNWVEDLDIADGIRLFAEIYELNQDFFVKKALPVLNSIPALKKLRDSSIAGGQLLQDLLGLDIGGPQSRTTQ